MGFQSQASAGFYTSQGCCDRFGLPQKLSSDVLVLEGSYHQGLGEFYFWPSYFSSLAPNLHANLPMKNCDALAFVESLFGHADAAVDVDALALERLVSVGSVSSFPSQSQPLFGGI